MYLIKTMFWLVVVIALLPTNSQEQSRIMSSAQSTVSDLRQFCARNAQVCNNSQQVFDRFSDKAKFGAKMLKDLIDSDGGQSQTAPARDTTTSGTGLWFTRKTGGLFSALRVKKSQNTLTAGDLEPGWSAPGLNADI